MADLKIQNKITAASVLFLPPTLMIPTTEMALNTYLQAKEQDKSEEQKQAELLIQSFCSQTGASPKVGCFRCHLSLMLFSTTLSLTNKK